MISLTVLTLQSREHCVRSDAAAWCQLVGLQDWTERSTTPLAECPVPRVLWFEIEQSAEFVWGVERFSDMRAMSFTFFCELHVTGTQKITRRSLVDQGLITKLISQLEKEPRGSLVDRASFDEFVMTVCRGLLETIGIDGRRKGNPCKCDYRMNRSMLKSFSAMALLIGVGIVACVLGGNAVGAATLGVMTVATFVRLFPECWSRASERGGIPVERVVSYLHNIEKCLNCSSVGVFNLFHRGPRWAAGVTVRTPGGGPG